MEEEGGGGEAVVGGGGGPVPIGTREGSAMHRGQNVADRRNGRARTGGQPLDEAYGHSSQGEEASRLVLRSSGRRR